jgi:hypothetical protein
LWRFFCFWCEVGVSFIILYVHYFTESLSFRET